MFLLPLVTKHTPYTLASCLAKCSHPIMRGLMLMVVLMGLSRCVSLGLGGEAPSFQELLIQGEGKAKILLLDISGPIDDTPIFIPGLGLAPGMPARIRQSLELAYEDNDIQGVLLRINSPGGGLTESDVIHHALMEFKRSKKVKIVASMGDTTASGGVYVAMAADEIYAHPTTITGSIGVIIPHIEVEGLMKKLGIRSNSVTSGKQKETLSPFLKRGQQEQAMLERLVNQQHQRFVEVIEAGRPDMDKSTLQRIADGRLLSAKEALKIGLIDGIGYLDDAYRRISDLSGFPKNQLVRYSNAWATGSNIYTNALPIEPPSN